MAAPASRGRQRGLALLFLLILIGLAGAFFLVNTMNKSSADLSLARDQKTQAALDRAKQALLTYAATVGAENSMDASKTKPGVPGYLPCPDQGSVMLPEGSQAGTCGSALVSAIGKLPWYSLGLEPLRDASGECLWYAVSGTYKNNPNGVTTTATSNMMNWDTPGLFDVLAPGGSTYLTGGNSSPSSRAVAVIFAPGPPLAGQSRTSNSTNCGGDYTAARFLETANGINNSTVSTVASAPTTFIAGKASDTFNDRLVYITRDELWTAIKKRPDFQDRLTGPVNGLTRKAAQCIAQFGMNNEKYVSNGDRRLPWASPLSLSATALSDYMIDSNYDDVSNDVAGRLSYVVRNSRSNSGSTLPKNNLSSPYYLFYPFSAIPPPAQLPLGCYSTLSNADLAWYENWKDHFFYAVASAHQPDASQNQPVASCDDTRCLQANSTGTGGPYYAAVVIFAGERLAGQSRETASNRGNMTNYLEGRNRSNISAGNGHDNYETGAATSSFNDILYCIAPNFTALNLSTTVALCP